MLRAGGDAEAAVVSHRRAIQLRPDFAVAHSNLGLALRDLGLIDEAIAEFRRALRIDPQDSQCAYQPDLCYAFQGWSDAEADLS